MTSSSIHYSMYTILSKKETLFSLNINRLKLPIKTNKNCQPKIISVIYSFLIKWVAVPPFPGGPAADPSTDSANPRTARRQLLPPQRPRPPLLPLPSVLPLRPPVFPHWTATRASAPELRRSDPDLRHFFVASTVWPFDLQHRPSESTSGHCWIPRRKNWLRPY